MAVRFNRPALRDGCLTCTRGARMSSAVFLAERFKSGFGYCISISRPTVHEVRVSCARVRGLGSAEVQRNGSTNYSSLREAGINRKLAVDQF